MRLRVGARTDTGLVRPQNEDAFMSRAEQGLFVVCDGMGGAPAGEVASELAIQAIARELKSHGEGEELEASPFLPHTQRLVDAVRQSNEFIYGEAQKDPRQAGMGTTIVGAWIREQIAGVAHVGDSRAYLWHNGRLEPLTRDHSLMEAHIEVIAKYIFVQVRKAVLANDATARLFYINGSNLVAEVKAADYEANLRDLYAQFVKTEEYEYAMECDRIIKKLLVNKLIDESRHRG